MDKESHPSNSPAGITLTQLAPVPDFLSRTPKQLDIDYQETMETRCRALLIDADVRTADEVLRRFCDRWDGEAAKTVPQIVLGSMKLAIFHHLGDYERASQDFEPHSSNTICRTLPSDKEISPPSWAVFSGRIQIR
jgi:hypothetical protein